MNSGSAFFYSTGGSAQWSTALDDLDGHGNSHVFRSDPASRLWYEVLTTTPGAFRYPSGVIPR